jgi:hypothetical protein
MPRLGLGKLFEINIAPLTALGQYSTAQGRKFPDQFPSISKPTTIERPHNAKWVGQTRVSRWSDCGTWISYSSSPWTFMSSGFTPFWPEAERKNPSAPRSAGFLSPWPCAHLGPLLSKDWLAGRFAHFQLHPAKKENGATMTAAACFKRYQIRGGSTPIALLGGSMCFFVKRHRRSFVLLQVISTTTCSSSTASYFPPTLSSISWRLVLFFSSSS